MKYFIAVMCNTARDIFELIKYNAVLNDRYIPVALAKVAFF